MKKFFIGAIVLIIAIAGYFVVNLNWSALFKDSVTILTEEEAREVLARSVSGDIISITFNDSATPYYVAEIQGESEKILAEVDAISSRVTLKQVNREETAAAPDLPLTKESAAALAIAEFEEEVTVSSVLLLDKNGEQFYEIAVEGEAVEAKLTFNVVTGELVSNEASEVASSDVKSNLQSVASAIGGSLGSSKKEEEAKVEKPKINDTDKAVLLTLEQAEKFALSKVTGEVISRKTTSEKAFEFEISKDDKIYVVSINTENGLQIKTSSK